MNEERPLMVSGRKITNQIRDRAPPECLPDAPNSEKSGRAVEQRQNRGMDGGPGP